MRNTESELCVHSARPASINEGCDCSGGESTGCFHWSLFMGQSVPVALLDTFPVLISLESSPAR